MVKVDDPVNKKHYAFLGFCPDDVWTAKKCKAAYEHLDSEGYNWYALLHDRDNGRPYLGQRVPKVDPFNTQKDKYDIKWAAEEAAEQEAPPEEFIPLQQFE